MKKLTCELCGSTDLLKKDGVFVCESCGTKYTLEDARKMMIEGTVDVSGSTVKIDNSALISNYFDIAESSYPNNGAEAVDYCNKIIEIEPNNYRAWLLKGKATWIASKLGQIGAKIKEADNCYTKAIDNAPDNEKEQIIKEVSNEMLTVWQRHIYSRIVSDDKPYEELFAALIHCGDCIIDRLLSSIGLNKDDDIKYYKNMIDIQTKLIKAKGRDNISLSSTIKNRRIDLIMEWHQKIKDIDPNYTIPSRPIADGCFIATSVYGSYDCPQVWILRRFRDFYLAQTLYGRMFIHTYYRFSPALVKWLGHTTMFKMIWKAILNKLITHLQKKGYDSTPYNDRNW